MSTFSSSHFYLPNGTCISGLREARLHKGCVPSPTTVLKMLKSEGLIEYFKRSMHVATATTPRRPEWSDADYYAACNAWAEEHGATARTKGGDIHDMIQAFHQGKLEFLFPEAALPPQILAYRDWYAKNVEETLLVEEVVFGDGYAGRLDHLCRLRDGRIAITDPKSQDTTKKKGRFNRYPEWPLQMGGYHGAVVRTTRWVPDVLITICLSTNQPVVLEAIYYERPPEVYHKLFMGLLAVWKHSNSFYPEHENPPATP
jgi:hypothetical protein